MSKKIIIPETYKSISNNFCLISGVKYGLCTILFLLVSALMFKSQGQQTVLLPDGALETEYGTVMKGASATLPVVAWSVGNTIVTQPARLAETGRSFRNVITLSVNEEAPPVYLENFTVTVSLLIEYKADYTAATYNSFTQDLTLEYKKGEGQLSDVKKYIHFTGAEDVKVTVTAFPSPVGSMDFKEILTLENVIYVSRAYDISAYPFTISSAVALPGNDDMLKVNWTPPFNPGNNAIQFEWAWLENELEFNYYVGMSFTDVSKERLLNSGATRVELGHAADHYNIPLLYDGTGKLHYRVRGVSIQSNGTRIYGPWSSINSYSFSGHETTLNWQVTTSFAEEGKLKSVIQYYDGSLRPRQTVTKDNASLNTVVAETLYDHEGRPAIQVLPAPGLTSIIAYQRNLNKFNSPDAGIAAQGNNENPADYFDHYFSTPATPALQNTVNGSAAQYYSSLNPNAATTDKNVPDAEGYPYTVTRYTPDASGRIQSQSGVGVAMKMGSGRETKYFYGSPKQEELDALFGTEVGDKSHYFKNMVQDANGQMSVSYLDMQGRTIATALAGDAPSNLTALDITNAVYYPGQNHTELLRLNLLDGNTNITKGNTIESINALLVPYNTTYNFSYTLTPESLTLPTCEPATPICYECLYDLEFSIVDESGALDQPVLLKRYSNLSVDMDTNCVSPVRLFQNLDSISVPRQSTIHFNVPLTTGSYTVRKTLTISEQSLALLKAHYLAKQECYIDRQVIFDSIYAVIKDSTNCDQPPVADPVQASCEDCLANLGSFSTFRTNYLNSIGAPGSTDYDAEINLAYNAAKKNCDLICGITPLETITKREMMLADMMPFFGQYAREDYSGVNTMTTKYNIFANNLYKSPKAPNGIDPGDYLTNIGQPDPAIKDILSTLTPAAFEELFQNKWAEALLPYHPEYQRLLFAEANLAESYNWINNFHHIPTYSIAEDSGFLFTSAASLIAKDPFFKLSGIGGRPATMSNYLESVYQGGLTLWQYAYVMAICKKQSVNTAPCNAPGTIPLKPFTTAFNALPAADKDSVWVAFKGLYLQERSIMMDEFVASSRELSPAGDHQALLDQGFVLHFPKNAAQHVQQSQNNTTGTQDWTFWPTSPGTPPNLPPNWNTPAAAQTNYTTQCESYIGMWKKSLEQCPALQAHPNKATIIDNITSQMVEVCRKGSSDFSPKGASTVAPSTPMDSSPRSFEEIITAAFTANGISITNLCNPFIIEYPRPYGMNRKSVTPLVTIVDSCNCDRFAEIKTAATLAGKNPAVLGSLNQYLQTQYGDTLTKPLFDALNRCSELSTPILNCDTTFNIIFAPCETNPCYPIEARGTGMLLKMQGDTVVAVQRAGLPDPELCLEGYVWNPFLGICEEEYPPIEPCPEGTSWDSYWQMCVGPGSCPPGYEWSFVYNTCVPVLEEPEPGCKFKCIDSIVCDTTYQVVITLSTPSVMPDFMQCGFSAPPALKCYTCTDLQTLVADFKLYFDAPYDAAPYTGVNDMNATQVEYMENLARYINYKTGMNYTWVDYMQAVDSSGCKLDSVGVQDQTVICRNTQPLAEVTDIFVKPLPCQSSYDAAVEKAELVYNFRVKTLLKDFEEQYRAKCMAASKLETFTVTYVPKEYHYTLYYYDQAGNLVKTVPPAGVRPDYSEMFLEDVKVKRNTAETKTPDHVLLTQYRYNSLNQVVAQKSPDGGASKFWYDKLGRLAVSQNAKQLLTDKYSYTVYDQLGRITEVGQKQSTTAMTQARSQSESLLNSWITGAGIRDQLTQTVYDNVYTPLSPDPDVAAAITQKNLRNRVSYTLVKNLSTDTWQTSATFYTYDIHGNVDKLLQDYRGVSGLPVTSRFKHISYRYDLISGKVNEVAYQENESDAFYHRYYYDAENRITSVESSRDKVYWEREAAYEYYRHGPLARTVLGKQQVQGVDYAYTLQGWLKGVNSTSLDLGYDIGMDGHSTGAHTMVARDIFGFGLHYYDNDEEEIEDAEMDYKAIGGGIPAFARPNNAGNFVSLYNGNVGAMSVNNGGLAKGDINTTNSLPLMYNYNYDQLNRIVGMRTFQGLNIKNSWIAEEINDYKEDITYDPNGNILTYIRAGAPLLGLKPAMDNLGYQYNPGTNQLNHVTDDVTISNYAEDIDGQSVNNYGYDAIGNLTSDVSESITNIDWTVYGKIASINKSGNTITYTYDAAGQRITKTAAGKTTLYVRDAGGNVMSVYEIPAVNTIEQKELHLYGSSRLGMALPESKPAGSGTSLVGGSTAFLKTLVRGEKIFELSNHLGNVLVTISDKKIAVPPSGGGGGIGYYEADVVTASDYAPFGMGLVGRSYSANSSKYRYGFNGKETDDEVNGDGNQYDYGFRIYNPRLGRFLSVDPLTKDYPHYTPYSYAGNKPIMAKDLDGLEEWVAIYFGTETKPALFVFNENLPPLGKNTLYTLTYNTSTGASAYETFTASSSKKTNVAFIPNQDLINKDKEHETFGFMSAYNADAKFFKKLDKKSENFVALSVGNLEEMAFSGAAYAMENNVLLDDAIIDFHGTQHLPQRTDGQPHKLDFGATSLQVNPDGSPLNYNAENAPRLLQLLGKFRTDDSQTLMGACNADKCIQILQNVAKDGNTTVYGHKSYSYSSALGRGRFFGGISKLFNKLFDGNSGGQGKYLKVTPNGTTTNTGGVTFSTSSSTAGDIKEN